MSGIDQESNRPGYRRFLVVALIVVVALVLVVGLQELANAFPATFDQDACSHYISGAMIHDYIVRGGLTNPVHFLSHYYEHYPLIGIGHWGPFYYGIEALWMMLFSSSQSALLLLSATVTVATALSLYLSTERQLGIAAALFVGLAYIVSPLTQNESAVLMLDGPIALVCLCATLIYANFMHAGKLRDAVLFGFFAAAGLLIKGNAGCLALVPVFAVLIGRRFDLPFKLAFWAPVPIVAILAGLWYYLTWGAIAQGFRYGFGIYYASHAAWANFGYLLNDVGPLILALALISIIRVCGRLRQHTADGPQNNLQICAASLFCAAFVFQLAVPAALQARYMLLAVPPILILAAIEADYLSGWICQRYRGGIMQTKAVWQMGAFAVLIVSLVPFASQIPNLKDEGFAEAAQQVWRNRLPDNPVVLIAGDAKAECASIVGLAMLDKNRPSIFVVRGSRLLGGGGYNNQDYRPRFADVRGVMAEIDRYKIPFVLFRNSGMQKTWLHLAQIQEARALYPGRWKLIYRDTNHSAGIFLFRIKENVGQKMDEPMIAALNAAKGLKD
jgi:hypothetical protein